ncbi:amidohydrolase [Candidatus Bathyarchaeota archaeon]|nr:amidohydrolase [Candidatus Bathyarchaeota archaeon]
MSIESCARVLLGGTLIDGTGKPPIKDSVVIIKGEYILAVGKKNEVKIPERSEIYDISGMTIMPGLIDAHCHFSGMGVSMLRSVGLRDTPSLEAAMKKLQERTMELKKGEWIQGRGWDESKWPENRYPTKIDLDKVSTDHPIYISRVCGHAGIANSLAMKLAGIDENTPQPSRGSFDIGKDGSPTGVFRDSGGMVTKNIPSISEDLMVEGILKASDYALSLGCTGIQDAGVGPITIKAYQTALKEGKLKVRAFIMLSGEAQDNSYALGIKTGFGNNLLKIGSTKLMIDGSLGARTALLFEPYSDDPTTKGLPMMDPNQLKERAKKAHLNNSQIAIHAIGDLAIEYAIDAIQYALKSEPRKNHRHRIEHCEILTASQIERIKELGIIPSVQPNFVGEWAGPGSMYEQRLGLERNKLNNPYRFLIDEGITICFGSDGMPFGPIYGLWSAVNHGIKGSRISLVEAVKCYTLNSAFSSFEEDLKGSVEPGKLADITIVEKDMTTIPSDEIKDVKVYMTIIGGNILYHKEN